jgi:RNA 3'-terminal phosphate cyclase (ATP)
VTLEIESEQLTELFTGFGAKGTSAEAVADQAIEQARRYLAAQVPVGEYLADQLLLPLAMAGGGSFVTDVASTHMTTNLAVIELFLPKVLSLHATGDGRFLAEARQGKP